MLQKYLEVLKIPFVPAERHIIKHLLVRTHICLRGKMEVGGCRTVKFHARLKGPRDRRARETMTN